MAKGTSRVSDEIDETVVAAKFRRQIRFWLVVILIFAGFLWLFSEILLPFAAGMILAYFLDPLADWLQRRGLSRFMATNVILVGFLIILALAFIVVVPLLVTQISDLASRLPDYLEDLQGLITRLNPEWLERRFGVTEAQLREWLSGLVTSGAGLITTLMGSIWASGVAVFNIVGLLVVTPVVAFYMLLDWDRMVARIDSWVPREYVPTVRRLAGEINEATAGFVRGQGTLCIVLGILYAIALTAAGLNFGILIGLFVGLISFIPYVGSLVGMVLSIGVGAVQFWPDWTMIIVIAAIFFVGQFIEGNILQPRLIGDRVGLHAVWLMFALFAFGALFGFVGLLVAVPAAAAVGVLIRFAIEKYLESPLYTGHHPEEPPPEAMATPAPRPRPRAARKNAQG
ncbi:MAG: AI-2E family transporter [Rhizobiaceae bacterium]